MVPQPNPRILAGRRPVEAHIAGHGEPGFEAQHPGGLGVVPVLVHRRPARAQPQVLETAAFGTAKHRAGWILERAIVLGVEPEARLAVPRQDAVLQGGGIHLVPAAIDRGQAAVGAVEVQGSLVGHDDVHHHEEAQVLDQPGLAPELHHVPAVVVDEIVDAIEPASGGLRFNLALEDGALPFVQVVERERPIHPFAGREAARHDAGILSSLSRLCQTKRR